MNPLCIHLVGRQDQGKTTLLVELTEELRRRGLQVGSIKHSGHRHELDTPGKDSHRHRTAGANPAAIITRELTAVFIEQPGTEGTDPYAAIAPLFAGCDLVLVEGDHERPGTKIEVWRAAAGRSLLGDERNDILAIVTDDPVPRQGLPVWPRSDVTLVADRLLALAHIPR